MKTKEPEVTREIRAVRERMAHRVEQEGIFSFYASLEGRAAKLMARHRSPRRTALPRGIAARNAKRRALVDALPESKTIQEIRRIRQEMLAEENRGGGDKHGLRYVDSPSCADVLHDKPAKKNKVH
jgi:hypothetical protein